MSRRRAITKALGCLWVLVGCGTGAAAPGGLLLVRADAIWRHTVTLVGNPDAWSRIEYDDARWSEGPAPLGYGQSDLASTTARPTDDADPAHLTVYFRHAFEVADPQSFLGMTLRYQRDDGVRLLLNGRELLRHGLPPGELAPTTKAARGVGRDDEDTWYRLRVDARDLRVGSNLLAAEVHQVSGRSSDLRFAAELIGTREVDPVALVRGPYLQQTTNTGTLLRFQTNRPAAMWVGWGAAPGSFEHRLEEADPAVDHEVRLELPEAGAVYYGIGIGDRVLVGGDEEHRIVRPEPGAAVRAWITGDQGSADHNARNVLAGLMAASEDRRPGLWVTLGDNAYPSGTLAEFQAAVFDTYAPLLRGTTLWPSLGNHDAVSFERGKDLGPYFDVFSLPTRGEAGGVPSNSERWYSFDWGPLHVAVLDTVTGHRRPDGAMLRWLEKDLADARDRLPWLIVAFHHPPYSRGSHDSSKEVTTQLVEERIVPILEAHGVDLALAGHSHNYERSRVGPGVSYVVAGHGSIPGTGPLDHPRMAVSRGDLLGSLLLDADSCRLRVRAIDTKGDAYDSFERHRPTPCPPPR